MNTNPHPNNTSESDAVMVMAGQVLAFLYCHTKKLALTDTVDDTVVIGTVLILPEQWGASTALQIGQIASEAPQSPTVPTKAVDRAIERLQLPQFKGMVLQKLGLLLGADKSTDTDLIHSSLKVTQLKNVDLVRLTVRGFSQADTQLCAKVSLDELVGAYVSFAKPSIDKINTDMTEVIQSIAAGEIRITHLAGLARAHDQAKHTETFPVAVLLTSTTIGDDKQLQALHRREISIREQLNPKCILNTWPFGSMFVSPRHMFPNRLVFTAIGLVLDLLVTMGWGLFNDCWKGILRCRG